MVSSTHWLASATGMAVLERGGNAFDAAVAAGFVLQVVEPHLNGPGGEVPILAYSAERDLVLVVNGQGTAPAAASIGHFRELGLDLVPGSGLLPACVPGAFGGWCGLLGELGTMRPREVLEHAIGYAEDGYPVLPTIASAISGVERLFREEWTSSAATYLGNGGVPRPGGMLRNQALAATWRRLLAEAEAASGDRDVQVEAAVHAFYQGFVAEAIDRFSSGNEVMDMTGRRHRGLLTGDDLARWRATLEEPATFDYRGVRVCKTGPWGQGPVFLQQLSLLAGFDLEAMGVAGADYVHTVVECAKLAFADREAWYGDPAFVDVPLAGLLDPAYAADRGALVGELASLELRPGAVDGLQPRLPPMVLEARQPELRDQSRGAGEPTTGFADRDTCHVDVADRFGNMVACTPSGGWLHSSPVIPELGFCLGTRGQMFWLAEGLPNSLEGGKRPRTTLTPTLALRDGRPWLAFGTPGGDQQDQWSLNTTFLSAVHSDLDLQEAIDAPNFHSEHFPSSFYPRQSRPGVLVVEERIGSKVIEDLRSRGHLVEVSGPWSLGRMCVVGRDPRTGFLMAAANPRGRQGYAVGR
ncbi:MAG TPA: gamma-glutamyltransferase family protein [Actinomycetes bacterium]|jgi:gamma-glutamyltranspeptidase/glutathione hydrolase|nr:gamma-glutamyltransferase family protein [Actinomycetes bacterium]